MGLAALQSVICIELPGRSGSPGPFVVLPFPTDSQGIRSTPAPTLIKVWVHPLMNFASSSENYSLVIGLRIRR
jgi:hypothetical protein